MTAEEQGGEASGKTSIIYNITAEATLKASLVRLIKQFSFCEVEYLT